MTRLRCWLGFHRPDRSNVRRSAAGKFALCRFCGGALIHTEPGKWRRYRGILPNDWKVGGHEAD